MIFIVAIMAAVLPDEAGTYLCVGTFTFVTDLPTSLIF